MTVPKTRTKTIYTRDADESMWAAGKRLADKFGLSESAFIADAMRFYIPHMAAQPTPTDPWAEIASGATNAA